MKHRVPCAPVRDLDEVVNDRHMHARRALEWVDHPLYGRMCLPNSALRFDGGAGRDTSPSTSRPPSAMQQYGTPNDGLGAIAVACRRHDAANPKPQ